MPEEDRLKRMVLLSRIRKDMEERWKWTNLHPDNRITTFLAFNPNWKYKIHPAGTLETSDGITFLGWGKIGVWRPSEYEADLKVCMTDPIIAECIAIRLLNGETHYTLYAKSGPSYGTTTATIDLAVSEDTCQYISHLFEQGIEIFNNVSTVK